MHKGLLFDLDGVIVDTAKYHYLAWKEIASELGIDFTEQDNESLKGVSRMHSFEIVLEVGGKTMSQEEKEQYCEKKNEVYLTYIRKLEESEILPGVREFLEDVKRKGYKIALGSASKNSRLILDRLHLTEIFDEIIDGTKTSKAKPDPEVFVLGAKALDFACEECIVFEDAAAGIEAAHAGGMQTVGIGSKERLPEADFNIPGFADIQIEEIEEALK